MYVVLSFSLSPAPPPFVSWACHVFCLFSLCLSITLLICFFLLSLWLSSARVCSRVLSQGPTRPLFLYLKRALLLHFNSAHTHTVMSHRILSSSRVTSSWSRSSSSSRELYARETHLYDSYSCDSGITCISLKFWKNFPSNTLFSGKYIHEICHPKRPEIHSPACY